MVKGYQQKRQRRGLQGPVSPREAPAKLSKTVSISSIAPLESLRSRRLSPGGRAWFVGFRPGPTPSPHGESERAAGNWKGSLPPQGREVGSHCSEGMG